jgi:nucleotide-binding universal stress UspA family protein
LNENEPILVGIDGSSESDAALETAADLGAATDRPLVVVYVRHLPAFIEASSALSEAMAALDELAERLEVAVKGTLAWRDDVHWSYETREGDPSSELIAAAHEHGASLIVVGHHGHSQAVSLLVGSVATRLVHHAPQSVLVARSKIGSAGASSSI